MSDIASGMVSGGAAATGAVTNGDSERTRDTTRETAAKSRREDFIRLSADLTFRSRNPASPRYHEMLYRGVWHPAGCQMARDFTSSAAVQYHSPSAIETT